MSGRRARGSEEKPRGLLYYLGTGISAGLLAFVVLLGVIVIVVPAAAGATPLTVLTSSMEPRLPPGTLIVVRPVDAMDIAVGDVITYQAESGQGVFVTHRVTQIGTTSEGDRLFTTKGDNNDVPDAELVMPVQVKGELWYSVPWIGYVNTAVSGNNRSWIVPAVAVGLFLYAGYMIASGVTAAARARRAGAERRDDATPPDTESA